MNIFKRLRAEVIEPILLMIVARLTGSNGAEFVRRKAPVSNNSKPARSNFITAILLVLALLFGTSSTFFSTRPHDDALHSPVMQPTREASATPTIIPEFEASPMPFRSGWRAITSEGNCDVNFDQTCDILDFFALSDAIRATGTASTPKATPIVLASATSRPRPSSTPRPTARATTRPTLAPLPTATVTPVASSQPLPSPTFSATLPPPATPVKQPTVNPDHTDALTPFYFGDTPEKFAKNFELVKEAAARNPKMPACDENDPAVHPITKWHSLVHFNVIDGVVVADCHYSHQHGMDPNSMNSIFGEPGAFLGVPGQSVSGPHQTFAVPASINDPTITPEKLAAMGLPVSMENIAKHTGYKWSTSSGSTCSATDPFGEFYQRMCVVAFRIQLHVHDSQDFHVRYHSFTFEAKVCADVFDENTCGIRRLAGWGEHSRLFTPPEAVRCWQEFNNEPVPGLVNLPSDDQFYESPFTADTPPRDEFRCHWRLSPSTVINNLNGVKPVPEHMPFEWWSQVGVARVQAMVPNPISGPDANGVALTPYCQMVSDTNSKLTNQCRWTGQRIHINTGYILPVNAYGTYYSFGNKTVNASDDVNGDDILDAKRFTDRFGGIRGAGECKTISLDCLPDTWEGKMRTPHLLRRNADGSPYIDPVTKKRVTLSSGYMQGVKDLRPLNPDGSVTIFDGDITPPGEKSWISAAWSMPTRMIGPVLPDMQELYEYNAAQGEHSH